MPSRCLRRAWQRGDGAMLPAYQRIIPWYAPYVWGRCAGYPNGRRQVQQIATRVRRVERLSAPCLGKFHTNGDRPGVPTVRSWLAQFAAALDAGWIEEVTYGTLACLVGQARS
jgi:hypothetical protein